MNEKILPLRNGVGAVVVNRNNKVFVGKRIDNPGKFWQMPQGGVDKGEDLYEAAIRELEEETSIKSVSLIKKIDGLLTYYLPNELLGIIWKGKFKGQKQQWYVMRFDGDEKEINIKTKHPEFLEWKWVNPDDLPSIIVDFKKKLYEKLVPKIKLIIG